MNSLQHTHTSHRRWRVPAEVNVRRIGPDHRQGFDLCGIKRQNILFVLQQYHGFVRCFQRKRLVLFRIVDVIHFREVDVWIVEESRDELHAENILGSPIDIFFGNISLLHLINQRYKASSIAQIEIDSSHHGKHAGLRRIGGCVMVSNGEVHSAAVAHDVSVEAPFVP